MTAAQRRYWQSAKGKANRARAKGRELRRDAHLCARPGCGRVVVGKKIGRRRQLCRTCSNGIRQAMLWGDDEGRTLPGLGVGGSVGPAWWHE